MKKIYVEIIKSKYGKSAVVVADLGYCKKYLTYDMCVILGITDLTVSQLYDLQVGEKVYIGD